MVGESTLIIGFRYANEKRYNSLEYVLNYYSFIFPDLSILLIEQDKEPKLDSSALPASVEYHFIKNDGLYNRSWAFNYGLINTKAKYICFSDSDAFISKEDFLVNLNALKEFEAVTPNSYQCYNIELPKAILEEKYNLLEYRSIWTFAAMICFIRREACDKIGSWDERFEGWGAEDNAFSYLVHSRLSSKSFDQKIFHIDHPRSELDGNQQPKYLDNLNLSRLICSYGEKALGNYIENQRTISKGDKLRYSSPREKKDYSSLKFVLTITTFNRLDYLKEIVKTWDKTKCDAQWRVIIADDGSSDGTLEYLEKLSQRPEFEIIYNFKRDICYQKNTLLKRLNQIDFDFAFMADDDLLFINKGWDIKYYDTYLETMYDHLVYYDYDWNHSNNLNQFYNIGSLESRMLPEKCQGAFFTITKRVLNEVGYFDRANFGFRGMEHVDYTFRACRAGFNDINKVYDFFDSNKYIKLQNRAEYQRSISLKDENKLYNAEQLSIKMNLLYSSRIYIPYNIVDRRTNYIFSEEKTVDKNTSAKTGQVKKYKYPLADDTYYPNRGIYGVVGYALKKIYNFHVKNGLNYLPKIIFKFGKIVSKVGNDINNISN